MAARWTTACVRDVQAKIKSELNEIESAQGLPARLQRAKERVDSLAEDMSSDAMMQRYVYAVSALVHHLRHRGLTLSEIDQLADIALAIVRVQNVRGTRSKLAFLYSELFNVLSQIYFVHGQVLKATWQQILSEQFLPSEQSDAGVSSLALATRLIGLGHMSMALLELQRAEAAGLSPERLATARLARVRVLRLLGDLDAADACSRLSAEACALDDAQRLDLQWEDMLRDALRSASFSAVWRAVRPSGTHAGAEYVAEAILWALAQPTTQWMKGMTSVSHLVRNSRVSRKILGDLYGILLGFDAAYDTSIDFSLRLQIVGERVFAKIENLSVEHRLLAWAALARWLLRVQVLPMSRIAVQEYRSLMRRMSNGATDDAHGLVRDILAKDWCQDAGVEATVPHDGDEAA